MNDNAHWLDRKRLAIYPQLFLALFLFMGIVWVLKSIYISGLKGNSFGNDFITFWAASHLALTGHAQDAYDSCLLFKAQQFALPAASRDSYAWFYPPTFYLLVLPLALLPYVAAYWTFMLSTLGAYLLLLRRIVRGKTAMLCIAAFSGLWINLFYGQNAFLTASLCGAALLCTERRPVLAGVFIGLLAAIKPHLAFLFPVALIAVGAWRILITAALTTTAFTAIGTAILGTAALKGFLANLVYARVFLENGSQVWKKIPSVFAFMRLYGIPVEWAYVIHFVFATGAAVIVWHVWRRCRNSNLRGAVLMTATFLISPYIFHYDLAWLAFPIAWFALSGMQNGWLRGEREVLVVAWLLPMLMGVQIVTNLTVQIGPPVICSLLWIIVRRIESPMLETTTTSYRDDERNCTVCNSSKYSERTIKE